MEANPPLRDLTIIKTIDTKRIFLVKISNVKLCANVKKIGSRPDNYDMYYILNIRHRKRDRLRNYILNNWHKTEILLSVPRSLQEKYNQLSFRLI